MKYSKISRKDNGYLFVNQNMPSNKYFNNFITFNQKKLLLFNSTSFSAFQSECEESFEQGRNVPVQVF